MQRRFVLIISVCWLLGMSACAFAQPQQSENFRITKSVLDAGGGLSTSTNFRLVSAFGQPTPVGVSSSANFVLSAGFLSPTFAASPLSPIQNLTIRRQTGLSGNVLLNWSAVAGASLYTVYRDVVPTFTPGPGNQVGTSLTNSFTDTNPINTAPKYFYIVTSTGSSPMAGGSEVPPAVSKSSETPPQQMKTAEPSAPAKSVTKSATKGSQRSQ